MRLLNTTTLELAEFFEADIPHYAILSHRWSNDEISFKEFRKGLRQESLGYQKVATFAEFACAQGQGWCWVDTICIDKRSSAELTEAINSMFKWYERSSACYVHLADVPSLATHSPGAILESFKKSVWFTRGWTLQELLAPSRIIFCTSDWEVIGSPSEWNRGFDESWPLCVDEMRDTTAAITGIPDENLGGRWVLNRCVAEKMRWASQRSCTRGEDVAYSLLGLFDVNMPLLYGEGGRKAFIRLQLEIIRKSHDGTILDWSSAQDGWQSLLAPSPRQFKLPGEIVQTENERPTPSSQEDVSYNLTNKGIELHCWAQW